MNGSGSLPPIFYRIQSRALIVGVVALVLSAIGLMVESQREAFFRAYLFAWLFWFGMSVGSLAWVMMHHLMGAYWSRSIQRPAEAATLNLWLMALLFIPVLLGLKYLYPWAWPELVGRDPVLFVKQKYLNPTAFTIRSVIYFMVWIGLAWALATGSRSFDQIQKPAVARRMRALSAGGILLLILSLTLAGVDWIMSRDAHWYSSILGFIISTGTAFTGLLLCILVLTLLLKQEPLKGFVTPQMLNDLGNLVLTMVILWAYLSFAQFLISWSGNIRNEVHWYAPRMSGWYGALGALLIVFHFFFPFFLLLIKQNKQKPHVLVRIALLLLFFRLLADYWLIEPTRFAVPGTDMGKDTGLSWLNLLLPIGIGGIWVAAYVWQLNARPVLAVAEHEEPESAEQVNHGDASTHPA